MSYEYLLNTTCTIEVKSVTQNSTTRQPVETWSTYASAVKCRLDESRGGEIRLPDNTYIKASHTLFLLYRTDLNALNHRIVVGSDTFNILLVRQAGGTVHHTEVELEIVK